LQSPHYGERWGRHWLDVAGYADSEGFDGTDVVRASAWRYRDYVVRSFNADKPFDRFIHEQLAGDEMIQPPYEKLPPEELDKLIATGFLRMAPDGTASKDADPKLASNQAIADTIQVVSTALMGLTVHCAQCHNHRYDPISQPDYYRMRAIFEPALDWTAWRVPAAREVKILSPADKARSDTLEKEAAAVDARRLKRLDELQKIEFEKVIGKVPAEAQAAVRAAFEVPRNRRNAEQTKLLARYPNANVNINLIIQRDKKYGAEMKVMLDEAAKIRIQKPQVTSIRALTEVPGKVPTTHLFDRGDFQQPKETIAPAHLTILDGAKLPAIPTAAAGPTTGRRLAFARALTSPQHPLTARVLVNRFWMHHFGKGLVGTPGDFGQLGERPTHPELLDWLAQDFMTSGWRLKAFHKLVMTSSAYRQTSARSEAQQKIDPDNRLLGRMPVRRLEAEIVRDAMLAVGGNLNAKPFGKPVPVTPDEFGQIVLGVDTRDTAGRFKGKAPPLGPEEFRRSLYVQVRRSTPLGMLETFDAALVTPNCETRNVSTVAPQSLLLMNSKAVQDQASAFAIRLQREADDLPKRVVLGWRLAYAQEPSLADVEEGVQFIREQTERFAGQKLAAGQDAATLAIANYCQALISSNGFLYVD
jgi:hypothetical protein